MPAYKPPHKKRRRRNKAVATEDGDIVGQARYMLKKLTTVQPKKQKHSMRRVHPAPMELGLTPNEVDGPGTKGGVLKRILLTFFIPFAFAMAVASCFPPDSTRIGAKPPFVTGLVKSNWVTYNPKSTGIEFESRGGMVWLRRNVTYARMKTKWNLKQYHFRNHQFVYVYAVIGRELDEYATTANGTYQYMQHMKINLVSRTADGLGEIVLVEDFEKTVRVRCERLTPWCRKVPVAVVDEINDPVFEVRVRFSRPARGDEGVLSTGEALPMWNSSIPIKAYITYETIPESWMAFEFIVRYFFQLASLWVVGFQWKKPREEDKEDPKAEKHWLREGGFALEMWHRPFDDWTAERIWCAALFAALIVFNEPLWPLQTWVPDLQNEFRGLHAIVTPLALSVFPAHVAWLFYSARYVPEAPPALVMWIDEDQKRIVFEKAEEARLEAEEKAKFAAKFGMEEPKGMEKPPRDPIVPETWQRPPPDLLHTPLFYMASKKVVERFKEDYEEMEEAELARKEGSLAAGIRKQKRKKKKKQAGAQGLGLNGAVTPATDGLYPFLIDSWERTKADMSEYAKAEPTLDGPGMKRWRGGFGIYAIVATSGLLWIATASLSLAQLNNGPTPRPRLTLVYAFDQFPVLAALLVAAVALQQALVVANFAHSYEKVALLVPVHACFLAVTLVFNLVILLGFLNCSFYIVGTPLMETIVLRTLPNCYAWMVPVMVKPLADDGTGRFPKRPGMGPGKGPIDGSSSDEGDDAGGVSSGDGSGDEEAPSVRTVVVAKGGLTVPSMGGLKVEDVTGDDDSEDSDSSSSSDDSSEDEDDGDDTVSEMEGGKGQKKDVKVGAKKKGGSDVGSSDAGGSDAGGSDAGSDVSSSEAPSSR